MKKLYGILGGLALVAASASAQDIYIIGANVDGEEWALGTNQMTANGDGTYSWEGSVLGSGFKFNDGTWDSDDYNFGAESGKLVLGQPFKVIASGSSGNINFDGLTVVENPKVVFDLTNLTVTVTGDAVESDPNAAVDLYVIGGNVDGENWALGTNKMTNNGDGTYTWTGNILGSGFKINDGTWSNDDYNIGAADDADLLTIGTPFSYTAAGSSKDINFSGEVAEVEDPVVVINLNEGTILVTDAAGVHGIEAELNGVETIYNLQGVRVSRENMVPGIYVINGKKIAVK